MMQLSMRFVLALGMFLASLGPTAAAAERRQVISLDGTWQIAEGLRDRMPSRFDHQIPVPGLADMARPPFENVGNDREPPIPAGILVSPPL